MCTSGRPLDSPDPLTCARCFKFGAKAVARSRARARPSRRGARRGHGGPAGASSALENRKPNRSWEASQRLCTTLVSSVFWRNVAIHYADAAGVARRPAGILKDGSVLVGADYEEGVERRGGKERRVRRELDAGLADQPGGKREVAVPSRR